LTVAHGWTLFAHPLFVEQLKNLTTAVKREQAKNPESYRSTANARLLAAIHKLTVDVIPVDPADAAYRQGNTLGAGHRHWFRAKFGNGRFRLFFRYNAAAKMIVYAWVNDDQSLRTYSAKTDAYHVFAKMLGKGNPPDDWQALVKASSPLA
jgi:toxin YhaV